MKGTRRFNFGQHRSEIFVFSLSGSILGMFAILSLMPQFIAPSNPFEITANVLAPPNLAHPFGTDSGGRDILSRVIFGSQISISVALIAISVALVIGPPLGLLSGYIGGKFDRTLSIPMDAIYAFPGFLLALLLSVMLGLSAVNTGLAVGFSRVPTYFRVVRSITLSLKEQQLVEVERSLGASHIYIILRHILPSSILSLIALITSDMSTAILTVAGLGFLGFGVPPPTPEWGTDLNLGREVLLAGTWWPTFFPGMAIFVLVLGCNILGEELNMMFNPSYRRK